MKKTLTLTKMGCDFFAGDDSVKTSDCENYRIETRTELVNGKDGNDYFLSFGRYEKREIRYNRRKGAPLKHPVVEVTQRNALHVDTEFENERGAWRNIDLERELCELNLTYTKADILKAVNFISADTYTDVEIIEC